MYRLSPMRIKQAANGCVAVVVQVHKLEEELRLPGDRFCMYAYICMHVYIYI